MFGRFLELAIATPDIAASVQFYERLGFVQLPTSDAWPHRYGVLSDGRLHLGLHECAIPSPAVCFVLPELAHSLARLQAAHIEPELARLGEEGLNELRLRDPGGNALMLLEARTYSPGAPSSESLCGYFSHLSLPEPDFKPARAFWELGGFVALPALKLPYPHVPLTSDHLDLAFHRQRTFEAPLLVFECADLARARDALEALGAPLSRELPRGVAAAAGVSFEAPEGTRLWVLAAAG